MSRDTPAILLHAQLPDGLFLRHTRRWQGDSKDLSQGAILLKPYFPPAEESALAKLLQEISGNVTRPWRQADVRASPTAGARATGGLLENSPAGEKRGAVCAFGDRKKLSALVVEQDPAAVSRDDRADTA